MGNSSENLVYIEDTSVARLFKRLHRGMRIKSRIVLVLDGNRYLLRIQGRNMLMQSSLSFKRKEEIWIEVKAIRPKLQLRLLKIKRTQRGTRDTNFIV